MKKYVGFDIGGTFIKYGLVDETGKISKKGKIKTNYEKDLLVADLAKIVRRLQEKNGSVDGVGISAPGIIRKDGFMTTAGSIKPLYGTNLKVTLENELQLPVIVENDGNAAAIAERWIGNAQGVDNYLCIVLGTGLGAGIVINGEVYRGQHGMAGEFGWMMIKDLSGVDDIELVSMNWRGAVVIGLCRLYNEARLAQNPEAQEIEDAKIIFENRNNGEQLAAKILEQYYEDLSVMLLNLISIFDPERILIGGGISANKEFMKELLITYEKTLQRHESLAYLGEGATGKILGAKLKNDAGLLGAVYQIHRKIK